MGSVPEPCRRFSLRQPEQAEISSEPTIQPFLALFHTTLKILFIQATSWLLSFFLSLWKMVLFAESSVNFGCLLSFLLFDYFDYSMG